MILTGQALLDALASKGYGIDHVYLKEAIESYELNIVSWSIVPAMDACQLGDFWFDGRTRHWNEVTSLPLYVSTFTPCLRAKHKTVLESKTYTCRCGRVADAGSVCWWCGR